MTMHKHLKLEQRKIDRAKRILKAKTESEAIERALDLVIEEDELIRTHRRIANLGGLVDVFGR